MRLPAFFRKTGAPSASGTDGSPSRLRRWAREFLILAVVVLAVQWWQSRGAVRGQAPALDASGLDGHLSLSEYEGKATMVHFWATWCGVCRAEEGNIESLAKGAPTITVAAHSGDAPMLETYRKRRGVSFPVVPDSEGHIAGAWGVKAYPTTFFVAPDGTIRSVSVGYTSMLGLKARLWWASLF